MRRTQGRTWRSFDPARLPRAAAEVSLPCRILGLDPGSLRTGFGVIDCTVHGERHVASGCIRTGGGELSLRLREIYLGVAEVVEQYQPQEVAIERVFVHRNPDSALKLGQARGAALTAVSLSNAVVHEYAPRAIKLAIVGTGAADKAQVAHMIRALLGISGQLGADAADALAVGLCHGHARRLNGRIAQAALQAVRR